MFRTSDGETFVRALTATEWEELSAGIGRLSEQHQGDPTLTSWVKEWFSVNVAGHDLLRRVRSQPGKG